MSELARGKLDCWTRSSDLRFYMCCNLILLKTQSAIQRKIRESSEQISVVDPIEKQEVKEEPQAEYKSSKPAETKSSASNLLENTKEIDKIVWFYSDGTYKIYQNQE